MQLASKRIKCAADSSAGKLFSEPINGKGAIEVGEVVAHVVAMFIEHQLGVLADGFDDPLRLLPGDQMVELALDCQNRLVNTLRMAFQSELVSKEFGIGTIGSS